MERVAVTSNDGPNGSWFTPHLLVRIELDRRTCARAKHLRFADLASVQRQAVGIDPNPRRNVLRDVGSQARRGIEALLGARVFLDLRVKVAKDWQRDPKQLGRLGF